MKNYSKKQTQNQYNDHAIDLYEVVRTIYKEIFLFLFIIIFFILGAFIYSKSVPNNLYYSVYVEGLSKQVEKILYHYKQKTSDTRFNNVNEKNEFLYLSAADHNSELIREILYKKNFIDFIKKENGVSRTLVKYLKNKKISIDNHVRDTNLIEYEIVNEKFKGDSLLKNFIYYFPEGVEGDKILNNYIMAISKKVLTKFLIELKQDIKYSTFIKRQNISIVENMMMKKGADISDSGFNWYNEKILLTNDLNKLSINLKGVNDLITDINKISNEEEFIQIQNEHLQFKWKPLAEKGNMQNYQPVPLIYLLTLGAFIGLIVSVTIIFGKKILIDALKKESYRPRK